MIGATTRIIPLLLCLTLSSLTALAQMETPHPHQFSLPAVQSDGFGAHETIVRLPEVRLRDSQDHELQLSTLLRGRIVVLDFVFTSCRTVCPAISAILRASESQFRDRLGKDVILVSISVDPEHDTPETLRAYANKIGAGPHWHWLTGSTADIDRTLRAFGVPTGGRPEDHPPIVLVGNADAGRWLRWVGLPEPWTLIAAADSLSRDRNSPEEHRHALPR